jgi:hypothetical protein
MGSVHNSWILIYSGPTLLVCASNGGCTRASIHIVEPKVLLLKLQSFTTRSYGRFPTEEVPRYEPADSEACSVLPSGATVEGELESTVDRKSTKLRGQMASRGRRRELKFER